MLDVQPCADLLAGRLTQIYTILTSDGWSLLFACLATGRAAIYYCGRSRRPEGRELAAAMTVGLVLAFLIVAGESQVPHLVKHVLYCNDRGTPGRFTVTRAVLTSARDGNQARQ
jgi:hypothetical protein